MSDYPNVAGGARRALLTSPESDVPGDEGHQAKRALLTQCEASGESGLEPNASQVEADEPEPATSGVASVAPGVNNLTHERTVPGRAGSNSRAFGAVSAVALTLGLNLLATVGMGVGQATELASKPQSHWMIDNVAYTEVADALERRLACLEMGESARARFGGPDDCARSNQSETDAVQAMSAESMLTVRGRPSRAEIGHPRVDQTEATAVPETVEPEPVPEAPEPVAPLTSVPPEYEPWVRHAGSLCSAITPALIAAQIDVESNWIPYATSGMGAQGLSQFMPGTWQQWQVDADGNGISSPNDPGDAITAQGRFMCHLYEQVESGVNSGRLVGDPLDLALAAYNAGLGNVFTYGGMPPFAETQNYAPKIRARLPHYGG